MAIELISRLKAAAVILLKGSPRQVARRGAVPPITAEEVAQAKQFFPREKFFIFGHARSGTTLLARLVRLHPQVHCNYQAHFFTRPPLLQSLVMDEDVQSWLSRRSNRWNQGQDLSPLVLRVVADFILERDAQAHNKPIVGDKSPNSLVDGDAVRLMHAVFPDARLIYIVRDGRDTALSHRVQAFIDAAHHLSREDLQIRDSFARDPEPFRRGERSIFTAKGIRVAAEGWVKNVEETDRLGRELYGDHYMALRYEDLLARPEDEMTRIWQFLGAEAGPPGLEAALQLEMDQNPDADWQQEKAEEIAHALQKGKHGSWRDLFTARDRQVFDQIAGETLRKWGYGE